MGAALVLGAALALGGSAPAASQPPGGTAATAPTAPTSIAEAMDRLERATAQRERVEAEIEGMVAQRNAARRRVRERLRALYRMKRAGMLPLAGGLHALLRHQSRVERLERMVVRDAGALRTLRRRVDALRDRTARLAGEEERARQRVSALRERERAQRQELAILERMIEDPAAWSGPSSGFGIRLSGGADDGAGFEARRGHLPLPVAGSAQLRDAEREGGAGVELSATPGVTVRAVGPGRVAFAARHPGYGELVILDHGRDHYTVYGGLGAVAVSSGATVAADAVLGTVGEQPLFFQVRRGTRPLPAREWLGI
jgi:septal ring factor EnvC (AmiA/AmiB activator)